MQRLLVSRIILTVAMAAGLVAAGAPAQATEPIPTFVEYTGEASITNSFGGSNGPWPLAIRIDCATGACIFTGTMTGATDVWDLEQGRELVMTGTHGEWEMSEWGDICSGTFWTAPGPMIIDVDADGFTFTRSGTGTAVGPCLGEASGITDISYTATGGGTLSGGNACVLDGSCAVEVTPVVSPGQSGIDDPGTLSTLPTVADSSRPGNILWAVGFAVVLVLLVAFPAHLLNTAAEHGTDRFSAWWKGKRATADREPPTLLRRLSGWPLAIAGVVVASLVSAFVDPRFGQDPGGSLRIFGSVLLGFLLDVALGWVVVLLFLRRTAPGATATVRFAPVSLLLVVAAVIFSRVTGFQPGIVFGLVAGVVIGTALATAQKARIALIGLGYTFVLGAIGWIAYTLVSSSAGSDPSPGVLFVQETVSAIAVGGMAALPIALFPLRGLTGFEIFAWNKIVWAVAYGLGLVGFFFVLMPAPYAWQGVPLELGVWVGLYLLYAVAAVAIWAVVTKPWVRTKTPEKEPAV